VKGAIVVAVDIRGNLFGGTTFGEDAGCIGSVVKAHCHKKKLI
jgi:hypothetical protein